MGLWDRQVEGLHALGVRFSDLELRTLEEPMEGVKVLHLHPLWDPETAEGQIMFMKDINGEDVWTPEVLTLTSPYEPTPSGSNTYYLHEIMESNYGTSSARYPSYFATVDGVGGDFNDHVEWLRRDEVHPYPFWTCLPLEGETEVAAAERLVSAGNDRLHDSLYADLAFVCEIQNRSEWCINAEEEWLLANDPDWLRANRGFDDSDQSLRAQAWDEYADPGGMQELIVECFQHLIDAHYSYDPRLTREEIKERNIPWEPIRFPEVTDYLEDGDFLAEQMWRSVRSRIAFMHHRMNKLFGSGEIYTMQNMEGIFG